MSFPQETLPSTVLPAGMAQAGLSAQWLRACTRVAVELCAQLVCTCVCVTVAWCLGQNQVTASSAGDKVTILCVFTKTVLWFLNPAMHCWPLPAGDTAPAGPGEWQAGQTSVLPPGGCVLSVRESLPVLCREPGMQCVPCCMAWGPCVCSLPCPCSRGSSSIPHHCSLEAPGGRPATGWDTQRPKLWASRCVFLWTSAICSRYKVFSCLMD